MPVSGSFPLILISEVDCQSYTPAEPGMSQGVSRQTSDHSHSCQVSDNGEMNGGRRTLSALREGGFQEKAIPVRCLLFGLLSLCSSRQKRMGHIKQKSAGGPLAPGEMTGTGSCARSSGHYDDPDSWQWVVRA